MGKGKAPPMGLRDQGQPGPSGLSMLKEPSIPSKRSVADWSSDNVTAATTHLFNCILAQEHNALNCFLQKLPPDFNLLNCTVPFVRGSLLQVALHTKNISTLRVLLNHEPKLVIHDPSVFRTWAGRTKQYLNNKEPTHQFALIEMLTVLFRLKEKEPEAQKMLSKYLKTHQKVEAMQAYYRTAEAAAAKPAAPRVTASITSASTAGPSSVTHRPVPKDVGAILNPADKPSPLQIALTNNHFGVVGQLLKMANTAHQPISAAFLHSIVAAANEKAEIALLDNILKQIAPRVLLLDPYGQTLLHYAVLQIDPNASHYPETLELLTLDPIEHMSPSHFKEILAQLEGAVSMEPTASGQITAAQMHVFKAVVANSIVEAMNYRALSDEQKIEWLNNLMQETFFITPLTTAESTPALDILHKAEMQLLFPSTLQTTPTDTPSVSPPAKRRRL